jgi:hypothetical protein
VANITSNNFWPKIMPRFPKNQHFFKNVRLFFGLKLFVNLF